MSTVIRPELSKRNKYFIDKHRYYELKHFCLQYYNFKSAYLNVSYIASSSIKTLYFDNSSHSDHTYDIVSTREEHLSRIRLIEQAALLADEDLSFYILKAVTEGLSYTYLKTKLNMPCCRSTYYDRYRRFFFILNEMRG